ncbi:MAG: prolyl oligopeptidase family serine peptidase, partial [Bacteroidota bacterium]
WHHAAIQENKQNSYDDLYAVAEDLIAQGITSPGRIGVRGGSNGGLLVGVAFTQRPDLFKAAVCESPLLDMKRYTKMTIGEDFIREFGDPDDPEDWAYIQKYSPYHNLSPTKHYPEPLVASATTDDRAHPAHARKMVAKMKDMGHSAYYFEAFEGGHGPGATLEREAHLEALIYTYLGMKLMDVGVE